MIAGKDNIEQPIFLYPECLTLSYLTANIPLKIVWTKSEDMLIAQYPLLPSYHCAMR